MDKSKTFIFFHIPRVPLPNIPFSTNVFLPIGDFALDFALDLAVLNKKA